MSDSKAKANWNVWGRAHVRVERAAPIVLFDDSSRKEYVTGFTKRKQQRRLIAQVAIKTKEKQMRKDEKKKRKDETEQYITALTGAKDGADGNEGDFINTDGRDVEGDAPQRTAKSVAVGSEATFATEDGGKVTATVSAFDDDDEDYSDMPNLVPLKRTSTAATTTTSTSSGAAPKKPKLKGNTANVGANISSSLKSKKRKNDHHDRKGFNKKSKH